ncbi:hypothetical protein P280DRAFT_485682 [Massarina eburnea CBS 473.64]|uniref:Uncharacterized protein n=1 Tax=Massarina eburnea CBS 473.64 TaxID=1395130 RepID=A0A6A6RGK4_9PLEO|nr:hypothetical protein P280DRAFT_485682 [Massarina eburnea CBS 473.64]
MDSLLFRLPQEVRDEVYAYYLYEPEGSHYNAKSQKMQTADNGIVNISLLYTCKAVAEELKGLAFMYNPLTLTTTLDETGKAEKYDSSAFYTKRSGMLVGVLRGVEECITSEVLDEIAPKFTSSTLDYLRSPLTNKNPRYWVLLKPWLIKSKAHELNFDDIELNPKIKKYWTATAAASMLLSSIGKAHRSYIRKVILKEDHNAVAFPEYHAQALVPFCLENGELNIERRVNNFEAIPLKPPAQMTRTIDDVHRFSVFPHRPEETLIRMQDWIDEAALLHRQELRKESFSLILEGPHDFKQQIWNIMKRAASA